MPHRSIRIAIAIVAAITTGACSFATLRGPGASATAGREQPTCHDSRAPMALDIVGAATATGVGVMYPLVAGLSDLSEGTRGDDPERDRDRRREIEVRSTLLLAAGAVLAVSAIYGGVVSHRCRKAHRSWRLEHPPEAPTELDPAMVRSTLIAIQPALAACDAAPVAAIRATVAVDAGGVVSTVALASDAPDPRAPCLDRVLRAVRFPPTQLGGSFVYQAGGPQP